jgi:hypothetical protein
MYKSTVVVIFTFVQPAKGTCGKTDVLMLTSKQFDQNPPNARRERPAHLPVRLRADRAAETELIAFW